MNFESVAVWWNEESRVFPSFSCPYKAPIDKIKSVLWLLSSILMYMRTGLTVSWLRSGNVKLELDPNQFVGKRNSSTNSFGWDWLSLYISLCMLLVCYAIKLCVNAPVLRPSPRNWRYRSRVGGWHRTLFIWVIGSVIATGLQRRLALMRKASSSRHAFHDCCFVADWSASSLDAKGNLFSLSYKTSEMQNLNT